MKSILSESASTASQLVIKGAKGLDLKSVKVGVCVPTQDFVHSVFSFSLARMIQYNAQRGIDTELFYNMGTLLINQREQLIHAALKAGCTHVFFIDSDMTFPVYATEMMLLHNIPFVAGTYCTRRWPYKTVAFKKYKDWESYLIVDPNDPTQKRLEPVEAVATGFMMIKAEVFSQVPRPWFGFLYQPERDDYLGEDMFFCEKMRVHGVDLFVDTLISQKLAHVGLFAYTHQTVTLSEQLKQAQQQEKADGN